jgi:hypothetical protein
MRLTDALHDPEVSFGDKIAIGAACIEEEALMRTARLFAGDARAPAWYIAHGGRFRFSEDGEHLMIQVPVQPSALNAGLERSRERAEASPARTASGRLRRDLCRKAREDPCAAARPG